MKIFTTFVLTIPILISCSTYNVKKVIENSSKISDFKNSGIIFRISKNSIFTTEEIILNSKFWTEGYKKNNKLIYFTTLSNNIISYDSDNKRIYQLSINGNFLKFKSIGIIKLYLQNNSNELKNLISDNKLDSLIIYEINSGFSGELQIFDFESVLVIVDKNLNIVYLDYQKKGFEGDDIYSDKLRKHLLDKLSDRFNQKLFDFNYIEKNN